MFQLEIRLFLIHFCKTEKNEPYLGLVSSVTIEIVQPKERIAIK